MHPPPLVEDAQGAAAAVTAEWAQVPDKDGGEADKKDEAIVPTDLNIITDDDLRAIFEKIPEGVKFTMVTDCCHSGSMLDHPEQQISGDKAGGTSVAADTSPDALEAFFNGANVCPYPQTWLPVHNCRGTWLLCDAAGARGIPASCFA